MASQNNPTPSLLVHTLENRFNSITSKGLPNISTPHQAKFFRHIEGLNWQVKESDLSRFIKIYKAEALGKKHAVSTERLYSYLKDYPKFQSLEYTAQVNLWFWLVHHGIVNNSAKRSTR